MPSAFTPLRMVALAIVAICATAAGPTQASAQSAYDYPICARYPGRSGAMSCYYSSYAQCMATMSGIGGTCVESPYYRGPRKPQRRSR